MALVLLTAPTEEPITLDEAKLHLRVEIDDDDTLILGMIKAAREYAEVVTHRRLITQTWRYYLDSWPEDKDYIEMPFPPLQSISSITYTDCDGVVYTWSVATDSTGDTDGATATITGMTDTSDFDVGDIVTVSAGFPAVTLTIGSKTAATITLNVNSNAVVLNVTVTTATNYLTDINSDPGKVVLAYGINWPTETLYPMNPICIEYVCGYGTPDDIPEIIKLGMKVDLTNMFENRTSYIKGVYDHLDTVERLYYPERTDWKL